MLMEKYNDLSNSGELTSKKDIGIVRGMGSLFQTLQRELTHYLGSHSYLDPTYGSRLIDYTGYIPETAENLIRLECERIISKDERVVKSNVTCVDFDKKRNLHISITTIDGLDYEYTMEI